MTKRMLIDATQPEETRVVVVDGTRVDDFDFETSNYQHLKGNIYLARVTRVEPSLQAAFVEFGGDRHGFLAFSEIHPDYYRIPMEDREALLETQGEREIRDPDDDIDGEDDPGETALAAGSEDEQPGEAGPEEEQPEAAGTSGRGRTRRQANPRRYKIQEVITRRQILLVQVVKEQRGNKGASLTTYLSLAGRYCVLMPNTPRGGGVSRKITSAGDRKRLKQIVESLEVPQGMAIIVRTAGSERTRSEIRRDCEYLLRLWDRIREQTLVSTAPCLVHEEANLIRRSIRDLYTRDIQEVLVQGDEGYRIAKTFMRMLIPSHARRVQPFRDDGAPLLHQFQVENQLSAIQETTVPLHSGGYLVLNQTEALVAIDVNSGKATRARNVEDTAFRTNLEAAAEVARQLRLRDLAGLIVIDFIDMGESRNQTAVERRMKEAIKVDRARVQLGRISQFGLMELSRQRLRPSVLETSTVVCPHCEGTGRIRSTESAALQVLRGIEEEGIKQRAARISVRLPSATGFYILNSKRAALTLVEERYGFQVRLEPDDSLLAAEYRIEGLEAKSADDRLPGLAPRQEGTASTEDGRSREQGGGRRRRRSDRRRTESEATEEQDVAARAEDTADDDETARKRRRRGKRGGRRRARRPGAETGAAVETVQPDAADPDSDGADVQPADTAAESARDGDGQTEGAAAQETDLQATPAHDVQPDDATAPQPAEADRPRRRTRRPRRRSQAAENADQGSGPVQQAAEETGQPEPQPGGTEAETPAAAEAPAAAAAGTSGKGRTRSRRKADGKSASTKASEPATATDAAPAGDGKANGDGGAPTGKPDLDPAGAAPDAAPPAPASPGPSSGLVVEIMSDTGARPVDDQSARPDAPAIDLPVPDTARPSRRGWWNRPDG